MKAVAILTGIFLYLLAFLVAAAAYKDKDDLLTMVAMFFLFLPWLAYELWEFYAD